MAPHLSLALDAALGGHPVEPLRRETRRLIDAYRSGAPPARQVLGDPAAAAAYAAYRMPATHAAVTAALAQAAAAGVDLEVDQGVASLLDVGGGTGSAAWAVVESLPSLTSVTVLDGSRDALDLGQRLAAHGPAPLATATWTQHVIDSDTSVPAADLVTLSYLLGELAPGLQRHVVDAAAAAARVVLVVEPGTPRGYAGVLAARSRLLDAGWHVVAPCPHGKACPLTGADWCHFVARLDRSALHRRLKDGSLGHEDEKFSFVLALRDPAGRSGTAPASRVLRHPVTRKGLVQLEVCRPDGTSGREVVSRRQGPRYRHARDLGWGQQWQSAPEAVR